MADLPEFEAIVHETTFDDGGVRVGVHGFSPQRGFMVGLTAAYAPSGKASSVSLPQAEAVKAAYAILAEFCPMTLNEEMLGDYVDGHYAVVSMTNGGFVNIARSVETVGGEDGE